MLTSVISIETQTVQEVITLLQDSLLHKPSFFKGRADGLDLGTGAVVVNSVKLIGTEAIAIKYYFRVRPSLYSYELLPILQSEIPNFLVSTISFRKEKFVEISVSVIRPYDLLGKFGFQHGFIPSGFSKIQFIMDQSLVV